MNNFGDPPNDDADLWSNGIEIVTYKEFSDRFQASSTEAISLWGWRRISAVKEQKDAVSGS